MDDVDKADENFKIFKIHTCIHYDYCFIKYCFKGGVNNYYTGVRTKNYYTGMLP